MLSGHVSTIILTQDCDRKYWGICFNGAFNIINPSLPRVALIEELFTVRQVNADIGRICSGRERQSQKKQPTLVGSRK